MNGLTTIDWLEVISASDGHRARMRIEVHSVDTGGQSCCGIRIDGKWLVGQARPMLFDTSAAAIRFLDMVGVDGKPGGAEQLDINCRKARHCFHLSSLGGLSPCPRKQAVAARPVYSGAAEGLAAAA